MGKVGQESDFKSKLVTEICAISSLSNACVHTGQRKSPAKSSSPFIDWYRLLGVEEDAGIDVIRKRYHNLALQLHPDKNKHPKADIAFKLVSEAHACLSDNSKRRAFNLERWKNFCFQCNAIPSSPKSPKQKPWSAPGRSKSYRFVRGLKDIRDRFREETKVIEKCLRSNGTRASSMKESPLSGPPDCLLRSNSVQASHRESPVFNPSDYAFDGYPHVRCRIQKKPDNFWYLQAGNFLSFDRGITGKCDLPVFEDQSDSGVFKSKSACVHS